MQDVDVYLHNSTITPQPPPTAADYRAAVDELTTALNRRTAQLRCLIRAATPVLHSLEAIAFNDPADDDQTREMVQECRELRDALAVAELVK